jgi:hypothetical protein
MAGYWGISITFLAVVFIALPTKGEFRKIPYGSSETCTVSLPSAAGIPYRCRRWVDETAKLPFWRSALAFEFGQLSRRSWQHLIAVYAAWHNGHLLSAYDAQRRYDLLDFMPPIIQALDRHRFYTQQQTFTTRRTTQTVQLVTNCWGTVYEALRLAQRPTVESPVLFTATAQLMLKLLQKISTPVPLAATQPGDMLLLLHRHGDRTYLDHVVLVIDQGLFFEKAGTGDEVPYRFVDAATLSETWNPAIFTYEFRRPSSHRALPLPNDVFSLQQQQSPHLSALWPNLPKSHLTAFEDPEAPPTFLWIQPLPPLRRIQERFHLPQDAYNAERLWPQRP